MALPVFAMSCFRLPKDLCAKLTSIMTEFWWGGDAEKKKIAWVAWKKLCKPKELGGKGFKDIAWFNQALPSYAWRSIMHSRELLSQRLLKRIGNGKDTHVWYDNWILMPIPRPPRYRTDEVDLTLKVSDLIDERHGTWDVQRVRHLFVGEDANQILEMRPQLNRHDTMLLHLLQIVENPLAAPSLPPIEKRLWPNLWKVKTMPKIRHFLWRALAGALAVAERLRSRGIPVETTCKLCHAQPETICHVLFHCPVAKEVWRLSEFPMPAADFSTNSVFLNFHHLLETCKRSRLEERTRLVFPWILWNIWKSRNKFVFQQVNLEFEAWNAANVGDKEDIDENVGESALACWRKPCPSFIKCNVGSSWTDANRNCGVAWLTRNHLGVSLIHSRRSYSMVASQLEADLSTLRHKNVVFESSSYLAGEAVLNPDNFPMFHGLIDVIREKLSRLQLWSIAYVHSGANQCAEAIARSVTRDQRYASYVGKDGPSWLLPMIHADAVRADNGY
ncbi:hypothetical protein Bca52824_086321 [Brassica carinata]|uniref:Reverse transcriptase zinc-binding domain-containing protein n=1 Tax=Brassica carinata TaxID=52824 RepID=A0A8X7P9D9_BRACI|nr:hypothetical protein Bca52824_086321 [Brassica carinata]